MSKGNLFIQRSISGTISFLKESIFADEYASRSGFLQALDPRIKVVTILLFILAILFANSIAVILSLYGACLALALFSNISMRFFLKRTWVFIPIFSLFIAVPAIFSVFTPGESVCAVNILGLKLEVTRQGLSGAALFVARVISSVSFAVLCSITTKHFAILRVLRVFKVPQIFVMTIGISYRYIYLLLEVIENTFLAIKSRVGTRLHYRRGQEVVGWNISTLWSRSQYMSEDVYNAMLSRGYDGEPILLDDFKTKAADWVWLFIVAAIFIVLLLFRSNVT